MRPILAYASPVWGYAAKTNINILDTLQNSSIHEAQKPRLPDSIDHPIATMPPSRMQNSTLLMPLMEDLSRYGIEDCSYSPEAQKCNAYSTPGMHHSASR
ncbi:hypothetical protein TNCV_2059081 [Trichonephila clavipes]|nr:hypothetical protein TNCV_2059081 [Trichonephila clavipes]